MKIVVYPHDMEIGGSQINAIELAGAVASLGHEVMVFGGVGPLRKMVADLGLEFVASPQPGRRPSRAVMGALTALVQKRGVDLIHAYEWPPTLEASYGPHLRCRTPVVSTVMSMGVAPFVPRDIPLVVGTAAIRDDCLARGHPTVRLLEPPVDTRANTPGVVPDAVAELSAKQGLLPRDFVVVVVSRLVPELKREGILEAVEASGELAAALPIRLLIAGGGSAREEIDARASAVNSAAKREVVTLLGELGDPRSVYDRADVVLGMGSSALRGMAFAKPLVVQGERGFWELLTDDSLPRFLQQGWYGIGPGAGGVGRLIDVLRALEADPERRSFLGQFAREVVISRFSLDQAAAAQVEIYRAAVPDGESTPRRVDSWMRSLVRLTSYKIVRKTQRLRGVAAVDDFNAGKNRAQIASAKATTR